MSKDTLAPPSISPSRGGRGERGNPDAPGSYWLGIPPNYQFGFPSTSPHENVPPRGTGESSRAPTEQAAPFLFGKQNSPSAAQEVVFSFRSMHNPASQPSPMSSPGASSAPGRVEEKTSGSSDMVKDSAAGDATTNSLSHTFTSLSIQSIPGGAFGPVGSSTASDLPPATTSDLRLAHQTPPKQPSAVAKKPKGANYNVLDEQAPSHPLFTQKFQRDLQSGASRAKKAATYIQELSLVAPADEDIKRLLADAERLSDFHGSDTRTIAVLGDSGEGSGFYTDTVVIDYRAKRPKIGKSSLINSLLHFPDIAKTVRKARRRVNPHIDMPLG